MGRGRRRNYFQFHVSTGPRLCPRSCFLLCLFPAMPQLMHIHLPHDNAFFFGLNGKQSIQPYSFMQGCSHSWESSRAADPLFAAKCRSQELLRGVQGTRKREFQGACLTYFTVNMETHAIHSHSTAPYINPGMGPDVNTQPAGLENIRPLSCPLETWMGDTSPLKRPSITPFINLLPRSQCLAAWEVVLMSHFYQQLGGLQRVSSTPRG